MKPKPERFCFCILGWYFMEEFYEKVYRIDADKYIISHRGKEFFNSTNGLYQAIRKDLYFCENQGLEWGGYYQFNEMQFYKNYDFVIYCHDDLIIKNTSFVDAIKKKFLDPRIKVVGNGKNGKDWEFKFGKYKDRMMFEEDDDFVVRTVRGSFFAAKTEIFSVIGNFPVHWRAKTMKKGNISLRNFGYLVSKHFGRDSITYLEEQSWLETQYLVELRRGKVH